jgi:serine/threonine protein phosphatase 1
MELLCPEPADCFIFLGDYVDGWSQSSGVIDFLIKFEKLHKCIFIIGNHDVWLEEWLGAKKPNDVWLANGGQKTIESYLESSESEKKLHYEFCKRMHNFYIDSQNRLFIHAGFASDKGPLTDTNVNSFWTDRSLWNMATQRERLTSISQKTLDYRLGLFNQIFIGHTPTLHYDVRTPMQCCNVINLDTGAGFNGRLSAMDIDTKEYWQSDPVQDLYPEEKGRTMERKKSRLLTFLTHLIN